MDRTDELIEKVLNGVEISNKQLVILSNFTASIIENRKPMYQILKEADVSDMALLLCRLVGDDCDHCPASKLCGVGKNGFEKLLNMSKQECLDFYEEGE